MPVSKKKNYRGRHSIAKTSGRRIEISRNAGVRTYKVSGANRDNIVEVVESIPKGLSLKKITYKKLYEQEKKDIARTISVLEKYY